MHFKWHVHKTKTAEFLWQTDCLKDFKGGIILRYSEYSFIVFIVHLSSMEPEVVYILYGSHIVSHLGTD